ncbi:hypothetical protein X975_27121, partial [Stegodyphus mimosarum]
MKMKILVVFYLLSIAFTAWATFIGTTADNSYGYGYGLASNNYYKPYYTTSKPVYVNSFKPYYGYKPYYVSASTYDYKPYYGYGSIYGGGYGYGYKPYYSMYRPNYGYYKPYYAYNPYYYGSYQHGIGYYGHR